MKVINLTSPIIEVKPSKEIREFAEIIFKVLHDNNITPYVEWHPKHIIIAYTTSKGFFVLTIDENTPSCVIEIKTIQKTKPITIIEGKVSYWISRSDPNFLNAILDPIREFYS